MQELEAQLSKTEDALWDRIHTLNTDLMAEKPLTKRIFGEHIETPFDYEGDPDALWFNVIRNQIGHVREQLADYPVEIVIQIVELANDLTSFGTEWDKLRKLKLEYLNQMA